MHSVQNLAYPDAKFLVEAIKAWVISSLILLLIASAFISCFDIEYGLLGYISSVLSFLAALCAGVKVTKGGKSGDIYAALVSAAAITTILLTIGFLIDGKNLPASGVLSVVSFTFSGCAVGAVLSGCRIVRRKKKNKRKFT